MTATARTAARPQPTRRRLLAIAAVAAVLPVAAWRARDAAPAPLRWQGIAFGAPATVTLHHTDSVAAQRALDAALAELARVESIFSLFRADSWLAELNRAGAVSGAPSDFTAVLRVALDLARRTGGVYDPTMQPLWTLYFDHFVVQGRADAPPRAAVDAALARIDWRAVAIDGAHVRLLRPAMAVSLNSVAQGYATDRVAAVLRAHGFGRMLVDMGEPRALDPKPDGSAWTIAIADPRAPDRAITEVRVVDRAVATSGGYGTVFDAAGRYTHLIDARTGRTMAATESVTVIAPTATQADALSTALLLLEPAARVALLATQPGCRAIGVDGSGRVTELA